MMKLTTEQVAEIIRQELPNFHYEVVERQSFYGTPYLKIVIAASNYEISNVRGQYPQCVSLCHDENGLQVQIYGGNGGQMIYCQPDKNDSRERFLAMARRVIPFRKPKNETVNLIKALRTFCQRYKQTLIDNREILMYQEYVEYTGLIGK